MIRLKIIRTALESSLLASASYSINATLELKFRNGATYRYFAVPRSVFDALIDAESKGAYFNRTIRNHFEYQRLS
jgi:KTSC domain